jgi:hypothetical protein
VPGRGCGGGKGHHIGRGPFGYPRNRNPPKQPQGKLHPFDYAPAASIEKGKFFIQHQQQGSAGPVQGRSQGGAAKDSGKDQ